MTHDLKLKESRDVFLKSKILFNPLSKCVNTTSLGKIVVKNVILKK